MAFGAYRRVISNNDYVIIAGRIGVVPPPGLPRCKQRLRVGITFNYSVRLAPPGFAVFDTLIATVSRESYSSHYDVIA